MMKGGENVAQTVRSFGSSSLNRAAQTVFTLQEMSPEDQQAHLDSLPEHFREEVIALMESSVSIR